MKHACAAKRPPVTVPIVFVNGILAGVRARGENISPYLQEAGIAPELLNQAGARVTVDQYVALFRTLAIRRDDDTLGLLSRPLRRGSFALIARSAIGARTLDTAMRRAAHTFGLLQDDAIMESVRAGSLAGLALRFRDPAIAYPNFLTELLLRIFWRLLAWMVDERLPAAHFDFAFPVPHYAGNYGAIFPAPLRFDRRFSAFWFQATYLQSPVRRDELALRRFLANAQINVVIPRREVDAACSRLRNHLQHTQPQWPSLASCATALHMSPASLQRHLAIEGSSFQALKDELRRDLAITRLSTSKVPLAALASELGFSDSAGFQRAFKKWTGGTPGLYRRGLV